MLFRNNKNFRYRNAIHENIEESMREHNAAMKYLAIPVHNYGSYTMDEEKKKTYLEYGIKQIAADPKNPKPYFEVGKIYLWMKDYERAKLMFENVAKLDPKFMNVLNNLAEIYFEKKEFGKALQLCKENLQWNPKDAQTHINAGVACMRMGQYDESEKALKKAIELNPGSIPAYDNLIALFVRQKRLDRAVKAAKLAYKMTKLPKFGEAVLHITRNYEGVPVAEGKKN